MAANGRYAFAPFLARARLDEGQLARGPCPRSSLEPTLDEVRACAELELLRDRAWALAGEPLDDTDARVAASLEVEVDDLAAEIEAMRREVADEALPWAAPGEVSALTEVWTRAESCLLGP